MASRRDFPSFEPSKIPRNEWRSQWERWLRGFDIHLQSLKITDPLEKKIQLLALGGFEIQDIYYERKPTEPTTTADLDDTSVNPTDTDPYEDTKQILSDYFAPKQHAVFERHQFCLLTPRNGEAMTDYALRTMKKAEVCVFGASERESRENRVISIHHRNLKRSCCNGNPLLLTLLWNCVKHMSP